MSKGIYYGKWQSFTGVAAHGLLHVGDANGKARPVIKGFVGDENGIAQLCLDANLDYVLFEPLYCAFGDIYADDNIIFITNDFSALSTYGQFSASGNTLSYVCYGTKWGRLIYIMKAVLVDGNKVDLVDYCKARNATFTINATTYKENMASYSFAGNENWIFNGNYSVAWNPGVRTVTISLNNNSSVGRTWEWMNNGESQYAKGTSIGIMGECITGQFRNRTVINSFTMSVNGRTAENVDYSWGAWS